MDINKKLEIRRALHIYINAKIRFYVTKDFKYLKAGETFVIDVCELNNQNDVVVAITAINREYNRGGYLMLDDFIELLKQSKQLDELN